MNGRRRRGALSTSSDKTDGAPAYPCPYSTLEDSAFWGRSVARPDPPDVDPVIAVPFKLSRTDAIVTAGSCFAQHLSKRLSAANYNYVVAEDGYPRMGAALMAKYNYGTFSARYGNIYTARQLLQLFDRAYGTFIPKETFWSENGHWLDPFRPMIQPTGFETLREAELDQEQHLQAVRGLFESLDVLIFTLGLTEAWVCSADGAVLPVTPGCGAGQFDPHKYEFKNFEVDEIVADLSVFLTKLRKVNPRSRVIFTVSPVPLIATYSGNHVLPATTYSKSVLRVAADKVCRSTANAAYFPSYEIITGSFHRGQYFEDDLRNVGNDGVDHVMRVFFRHFGDGTVPDIQSETAAQQQRTAVFARNQTALDVVCEEYASLQGIADAR